MNFSMSYVIMLTIDPSRRVSVDCMCLQSRFKTKWFGLLQSNALSNQIPTDLKLVLRTRKFEIADVDDQE